MRLKYFAVLLLPFSLAACQATEVNKVGEPAVIQLQQQDVAKTLTAYDWSLDTGANQALVLKFDASGRLSISTSCNQLMTAWQVSGQNLVTQNLAATMKSCPAPQMQQEQFAAALFNQRQQAFRLETQNPQQPRLTLTALDGQTHTFTGKMTPETKYQTQAETIFLEVSPQTKSCTGVTAQTCLQVKQIQYDAKGLKTSQDQDWRLFYDKIEGFQHNPKAHQIIRVKRYEIKNPAADQSKYAYIYDMTVMYSAVK